MSIPAGYALALQGRRQAAPAHHLVTILRPTCSESDGHQRHSLLLITSILVIEDDPDLGRAMALHLRHAGFDVDAAEDGARGLRRLRHARPDIAIIDLMLPGRDGWPVTETIRDEHLGVPVIVVSARGSEHDKVRTIEIGADDYLSKPFGIRELIARVGVGFRDGA